MPHLAFVFLPCPQAPRLSEKKRAIKFIKILVHNESLISCCFKVLCLSSLTGKGLAVDLWGYPSWSSSSFLNVQILVFHQVWGVSGYYFFKCSFCPFLSSLSRTPIMQGWLTWWCSTGLWDSVCFPSFFFLSDPQIESSHFTYPWVCWLIFLLLSTSIEFLISVTALFNSKTSAWPFATSITYW